MRKKALLVGAKAGAIGPFVNFDGGTWEVESHPSVGLTNSGNTLYLENGKWRFKGKCRLQAKVFPDYKGPDIHLDARQVA